MTTAPARRRTDARYRGVVYGLDVLDHHTGQVVENDYVGKTRQRGRARELQHRDTQPFSDRIVGDSRVLWEGMCTEAELDEMERRFIQDVPQRPRLNYLLNEDNPKRIPKWVQLEQRHERDDRAGRPQWVPPERRDRASLLDWDTPQRSPQPVVVRKPWSSRRKHLTGLGVGWLLLSIAALIAVAVCGMLTRNTAIAVPVGLLLLEVWVWAGCPIKERGRRNARRRTARRLQIRKRTR